jgi:hypothetical protein
VACAASPAASEHTPPASCAALPGCNGPVRLAPLAVPAPAPAPLAVAGWVASQPLAIAAAACGRGGLMAVDSPSYATTSEIQIQPLASGSSVEGAPAPELLQPRRHRTSTPSAVVSGSAVAVVSPPTGRCGAAPTATAASSGASSAAVSTSGAAVGAACTPSGATPEFARRSSGGISNGGRAGGSGMGAGGIYRNGVLRGAIGGVAFPADPAAAVAVAAAAATAAAAAGTAAHLRHQAPSALSLPSPGGASSPVLLSPPSEVRARSSGGGGGSGARPGPGAGTARRSGSGNAKTSQITHQFSAAHR